MRSNFGLNITQLKILNLFIICNEIIRTQSSFILAITHKFPALKEEEEEAQTHFKKYRKKLRFLGFSFFKSCLNGFNCFASSGLT